MAGTNYSADKVAYNAAINSDITTQTAPNSIPPEVVGSGYTDLADLLEPYILRINNEALLQGSGAPSSGLGQDLDLYYQQTNPVIIWRKISGTWQQQVQLPFGVILPEGNMTVRTFIDDLLVNATKGGWSINNVIYQKATQTLITVTAPDANYTRIDNIYGTTSNTIIYQEGVASTTPVAPTLPANTVLIDNVIVPSVASGDDPYLLYGGSIDVLDSGVEGPSTSTDNAIVRWNGTTGDTVKDSNVLLNDAGDIIMQGTGAIKLPVGTTAERPSSPLDGHLRRNVTLGELEYYDSDSGLWKQLSAITPGTYIENQNLVAQTANYWISGTSRADGGFKVGSNNVWHQGNFDPANFVTLDTAQTITGAKTFTQNILGNANARLIGAANVEDISYGVGDSLSSGRTAFFGWRYNGGSPYGFIETYANGSPIILQSIGSTGDVGVGVFPNEKFHVAGIVKCTSVTQGIATISSTILNWNQGGLQNYSITANTTFTMINQSAGKAIQISLNNTSGATRTLDISGVTWLGSPILSIPNNRRAMISLAHDGSVVLGTLVVQG